MSPIVPHPGRSHGAAALRLAAAFALAACSPRERAAQPADTTSAAAPSAAGGITLPPGFSATVFADSLGLARHIVITANGDGYVNTWRSPYDTTRRAPAGGFILALRDTNQDGKADLIGRFGETSEAGGRGGTGIAVYRDALYVEAGPNILRYRLSPDQLVPTAAPDTIVTGLPSKGGHPMHPLAIDAEGSLFVNVGSATNSCQERDRQLESPGLNPCRELETRAGVWRFSATRIGQRFAPAARYATGIRNAVPAINPRDGGLYATQHGRDQLTGNWPKLYTSVQGANLPAEELLRVERGGDYGWPYCYGDSTQARLVLAPEYGGDGKAVGECAKKRGPLATFPAHWAPNALVFYTDSAFPAVYRGGVFIAFHGSWNRAPEPQEGYTVVFQPFADGKPSGSYQVFADGFAGATLQPGLADHRPAGLAVGPDGALYITDDQRGRVWRVTYAAQPQGSVGK